MKQSPTTSQGFDYSQLTDAELQGLASRGDTPRQSAPTEFNGDYSQLSDEQLIQLAQGGGIAQPAPLEEPTFSDYAQQAGHRLVSDFGELIPSTIDFMGLIGDTIGLGNKDDAHAYAESWRDTIGSIIPEVANAKDSFWFSDLPGAIGSMGSFIIPSTGAIKAAGGLSKIANFSAKATAITQTAAALGAPAALGAMQESAGQFYEAKAHGASDSTAWKAWGLGLGVGATEAIPVSKLAGKLAGKTIPGIFARIDKVEKGRLREAVIDGMEEFVQEFGQNTGSNLIAKNLYDDEREVFEGALRGGSAGFLTGFLFSALIGNGGRSNPRPKAADDPQPEGITSVQAQVDALNAGNLPAILLPEGSAEPEGINGDFEIHKTELGDLYIKDPQAIKEFKEAVDKGATPEEIIGDVLGYGTSEKPLSPTHVLAARDAQGRLVRSILVEEGGSEETAANLKAATTAAGDGGSVDTLPIEEAGVLLQERAGERATVKVQSAADHAAMKRELGVQVKAVQAPQGVGQQIQKNAQERGRRVVFVEEEGGKPISSQKQGFLNPTTGTLFLDANSADNEILWGVFYHEMTHALAADEGGTAWFEMADKIYEIAPEAVQEFQGKYAALYKEATGKAVPEHLLEEEGIAYLTENLPGFLYEAAQNPETLAKIASGDRTLLQKIIDLISEFARKIGIQIDSTAERQLKALQEQVAVSDFEKTTDPKVLLDLATTISRALDSTLGQAVPPPVMLISPRRQGPNPLQGPQRPVQGPVDLDPLVRKKRLKKEENRKRSADPRRTPVERKPFIDQELLEEASKGLTSRQKKRLRQKLGKKNKGKVNRYEQERRDKRPIQYPEPQKNGEGFAPGVARPDRYTEETLRITPPKDEVEPGAEKLEPEPELPGTAEYEKFVKKYTDKGLPRPDSFGAQEEISEPPTPVTRKELKELGFVTTGKHADFHDIGYQIVNWFSPRSGRHIMEYVPQKRVNDNIEPSPLGRFTAEGYYEQAAVHRAVGKPVFGKGEMADGGKPRKPRKKRKARQPKESVSEPLAPIEDARTGVATLPTVEGLFGAQVRESGPVRDTTPTETIHEGALFDIQPGDLPGQSSLLDAIDEAPQEAKAPNKHMERHERAKRALTAREQREQAAKQGSLGIIQLLQVRGGLEYSTEAADAIGSQKGSAYWGLKKRPAMHPKGSDLGMSIETLAEDLRDEGWFPEQQDPLDDKSVVLDLIASDAKAPAIQEQAEADAIADEQARIEAEQDAQLEKFKEDDPEGYAKYIRSLEAPFSIAPPWTMSSKGEGDLYIQRVGPNAGQVHKERQGPSDIAFSTDPEVLLPDYVYYVLQSLQPKINARKTGSVQQSIKQSDVTEELARFFRDQAKQNSARFSIAPPANSPRFKRWFKDSKVVDKDGKPLTVYHGTGNAEDLREFKYKYTSQGNDQYGPGFYFTTSTATASGYTKNRIESDIEKLGGESSPGVLPVFLSMQNPIRIDARVTPHLSAAVELTPEQAFELINAAPGIMDPEDSPLGDHFHEYWDDGPAKYMLRDLAEKYSDPMHIIGDLYRNENMEVFLPLLAKITGHDGVEVSFTNGEKHYIAWNPTQVKSAIGNSGEYNASNPDVRFSIAPQTQLGFYSTTEGAALKVVDAPQKSYAPGQIRPRLLKFGAKGEELDWMGLDEWTKGLPKGAKVPKEAILQFVRDNAVVVGETVLGGGPGTSLIDQWMDEAVSLYDYELDQEAGGYIAYNDAGEPLRGGDGSVLSDPDLEQMRAWVRAEVQDFADDLTEAQMAEGLGDLTLIDNAPARHPTWVLPGGEDYRELLLTLPAAPKQGKFLVWDIRDVGGMPNEVYDTEQEAIEHVESVNSLFDGDSITSYEQAEGEAAELNYQSSHFNQKNILAHARFNDRVDANGNKVLFLEEVQSDWHQAGREGGYIGAATKEEIEKAEKTYQDSRKTVDRLADAYRLLSVSSDVDVLPESHPISKQLEAAYNATLEAQRARTAARKALDRLTNPQVPNAPFKQSWPTLAMKRMIRYAAEHGYHSIAWTTGAQQADRYATELRGAVSEVIWSRPGISHSKNEGVRNIRIVPRSGGHVNATVTDDGTITGSLTHGEIVGSTLADLLGKESAAEILSQEKGTLDGDNLTIGGKAMIEFYDARLRNIAGKLGKKFGAKVEVIYLPNEDQATEEDAGILSALGLKGTMKPGMEQLSLPITDSMRESVTQVGQPLFSIAPKKGTPGFKKMVAKMHPSLKGEDGEPKVFYHGTHAPEFTEFRDELSSGMPIGSYFSASPSVADMYSGRTAIGEEWSQTRRRTYPVYLALKNPLVTTDMPGFQLQSELDKPENAEHDGVVRVNESGVADMVVTRSKNSVKSATGNDGSYDTSKGDIRLSIRDDAKAAFGKTGLSFRKNLTAMGNLPEPVFKAKIARDGTANSEVKAMGYIVRDFDRAVREEFGRTPGEDAIRKLDQAFKNHERIKHLPERLQEPVRAMRRHVDVLSRRMIDVGVIEGQMLARFGNTKGGAAKAKKAAATMEKHIEDNLGFYATRSYAVFDDPDWAKKVPEDVRAKAKALIRSEYPNLTPEQVDGKIAALLYEGRAAQSPMALLAQSKLGSKDLSILTKRKTIAPEIRALFGEYSDARVNYARSVMKMGHLIANHQFLERVKREGVGQFFLERPEIRGGEEFKEKIAADASSVMAPLNGLYTTPEIATAFREAVEVEQVPKWLRYYMRANGSVKFAKTIGSPMTHVRNMVGNIGFAVANGHFQFWQASTAAKGAATNFGFSEGAIADDAEWREYFKSALKLGVVHQDARSGELRDTLEDAYRSGPDDFLDRSLKGKIKRFAGWNADVYSAEDDIWKLYAWENEKARYRKVHPEWSETKLGKFAAEIVRNTYPTYSLVPRFIKHLRRFPLVGNFVSFPWEVMRVTGNTMAQMRKEVSSDNAEERKIGYQRLAGMTIAAAGTSAAAAASRFINGLSDEDDDDARLFMAPWDRNSDIIWLGGDEEGNRTWVNVSYTDPYSYLKKPILAFMRGEDWDNAIIEAGTELLSPFFGEEILAGKIVDVTRNTTGTGSKVYNPQAEWEEIAGDIAEHIGSAFEPGAVSSMRRIYKGLTDYVEPYGKKYDAGIEALAVATGVRRNSLDVQQSLSFLGSAYSRGLSGATSSLSSVASKRGTVSEEELRDAYESAEQSRKVLFRDIVRAANAAISLGVPRADVERVLRSGLSEEKTKAILAGRYVPYSPSSSFLRARSRGASPEVVALYNSRRTLIQRIAKEAASSR